MNGDELKVLSLAVRALDRADCTIEIDDFFPSGCAGLANEISSIITKYIGAEAEERREHERLEKKFEGQ